MHGHGTRVWLSVLAVVVGACVAPSPIPAGRSAPLPLERGTSTDQPEVLDPDGTAAGDARPEVPSAGENPFELKFDAAGALARIQGVMLTRSLPLVSGVVSKVVVDDSGEGEVSFEVVAPRVVWKPTGAPVMTTSSIPLSIRHPGAATRRFFEEIPAGTRVLVVPDGSDVLALAALAGDGTIVRPAEPAAGPLFLGEAIAQMADRPESFFIDSSACEPTRQAVDTAPIDALLAYFDYYGDRSVGEVAEKSNRAWAQADKLEGELAGTVDQVSGRRLAVDINDVYLQLMAGVDPELITPAASVNVAVDLAGVDEARMGEIMVLFESASGRLLGWFQVGRLGRVTAEGDVVTPTAILEVLAPGAGHDVAVAFRPPGSDPPRLGCPVTDSPDLIIPYADFAGPSRRALVEVASRTARPVGADYFDQLP